jgi:prophage regulatory protein
MGKNAEKVEDIRGAIRIPRVRELTSASRATIWRWLKSDPTFPRPFHLSKGITCWDEGEILDWIAAKKSQRDSL